MFYTAIPSAHSASLRLCVKNPLPLYTFYTFYTANPLCIKFSQSIISPINPSKLYCFQMKHTKIFAYRC